MNLAQSLLLLLLFLCSCKIYRLLHVTVNKAFLLRFCFSLALALNLTTAEVYVPQDLLCSAPLVENPCSDLRVFGGMWKCPEPNRLDVQTESRGSVADGLRGCWGGNNAAVHLDRAGGSGAAVHLGRWSGRGAAVHLGRWSGRGAAVHLGRWSGRVLLCILAGGVEGVLYLEVVVVRVIDECLLVLEHQEVWLDTAPQLSVYPPRYLGSIK